MAAKLFLTALLAVLVVGILESCVGSPLCTPEQWQGHKITYIGYLFNGQSREYTDHEVIYYDANNKKKARFISFVDGDMEGRIQVLEMFDEKSGVSYTVDIRKGRCMREFINHPFRRHCIPDSAKALDRYHLGLKTGGVSVSSYKFAIQEKGKDEMVYALITKDGDSIIPLAENVFGNKENYKYFESGQYGNIVGSIYNSTVFDIPKECEKAENLTTIEYFLRGPHRIEI